MKDYELIYVARPDLTDEQLGTVRSDVRNQIETLNGTIDKEDPWGKKQLAFEIRDFTEGVYTFIELKCPTDGPQKLKKQFKIDERIIRFMITAKVRKVKEKEKEKEKSDPEV